MEYLNLDQPKPRRKRRTKAEIKAAQGAADMAWLEELAHGKPEPTFPIVAPQFVHQTRQGEVHLMMHNILPSHPMVNQPTLEERVERSLSKLATIISNCDAVTKLLLVMHQGSFDDAVLERQLRSLRDQIDIINVESRRIRNNLKDA